MTEYTTKYTIIEPHIEFIDPPNETNYLEFLEKCTRVCYKSEEYIKPGSAEKLMSKVVKEYEHYSVTEHATCILKIKFDDEEIYNELIRLLLLGNPLFSSKILDGYPDYILVSGNIRMWMEWYKEYGRRAIGVYIRDINNALNKKWPFFFPEKYEWSYGKNDIPIEVEVLDENPISNRNNLTKEELDKLSSLTFKFVGDRSMSHQLVRHRLFPFSQESQTYSNY